MSFKEIETFPKALRYIQKQNIQLNEVERKNIKSMYEVAKKEGFKIGVQMQFCPFCNKTSDGGGLMMVKDEKEMKDIIKIMCMSCMELSKILVGGYNFNADETTLFFDLIKKVKENKGI